MLTDRNMNVLERNVLKWSGVEEGELKVLNVKVCENVTIRTTVVGSGPPLVFLHGFGASGALYYKTMKLLSLHFKCHYMDLIGMGGSSRSKDFDSKGSP